MKNLLILLCGLLSAQIVLAQLSIKDTLLQAGIHASLPMSGDRPVCLSLLPNGNLCYSDLGGNIYEIANGNRQLLFDDSDHHF